MNSPRSLVSAALILVPSLGFGYEPTAAEKEFPQSEPVAAGKFQPTWESLQQYEIPQWYRDAKFGIWAHWGPQCQPEMGDWYGRRMYESDKPQPWSGPLEVFHTERYGHPSKVGFKDVIHLWWAENWDPKKLMSLYKRAGAKYFMALANHHDNFDNYDSKYQPWNSTRFGPKKDLVGGWAAAAREEGLRFGVSVHASHAWSWYETSQGADKTGPLAGIPYDGKVTAEQGKGTWWEGMDPQDLYAQNHPVGGAEWDWTFKDKSGVPNDPRLPSGPYLNKFYNRTVDLINKYHPDLIYFDDDALPFEKISDVGLKIAAHFYNTDMARHGGKLEAVINGKHLTDLQKRCLVYDIERGKAADILPLTWQTDTCIGSWHYERSIYEKHGYKKANEVIHMLADIVSKNGNLMLNVPLRGDGTPDPDEVVLLTEIGDWMQVNQEAIFETKPWSLYGEGPSTVNTAEKGTFDGIKDVGVFTAADVRYTQKGSAVYAIVLGWPADGTVTLPAFAEGSNRSSHPIKSVTVLGQGAASKVSRDAKGLHVTLPRTTPDANGKIALVIKIES